MGTLTPVSLATVAAAAASAVLQNNLDMNSNRIVNLAAPVNPNDAARKVDTEGITLPVYTPTGVYNVNLSK